MPFARRARVPLLVALIVGTSACGARGGAASATPAQAAGGPTLHVVAEGPCAKLSVQTISDRTFVVYGDTGYDLHDWAAGEQLAAAQAVVEIKDGTAHHLRGFTEGLPLDAGGYVPADLRLGGSFADRAWLVATDTRYAPRGKGALFAREARSYVLAGSAWQARREASPVELPSSAASLPALPEASMCPEGTRFVVLAATVHAHGDVHQAGRCQGEGPISAERAPIWIAHGAPGSARWEVHRAPESHVLDGIVNVAFWSRRPDETWMVAYEPFKPPAERQPYLARWDGRVWAQVETGLPEGLMSVTGTADGVLWIAAGRGVYRMSPGGTITPVPIPALRFADEAHPASMRLHTVRATGPDDVWIEGAYRARVPPKDGKGNPTEQRASVLFRSKPAAAHFCDAREPAELAFTRVDP